jgi:hypothetical protein
VCCQTCSRLSPSALDLTNCSTDSVQALRTTMTATSLLGVTVCVTGLLNGERALMQLVTEQVHDHTAPTTPATELVSGLTSTVE